MSLALILGIVIGVLVFAGLVALSVWLNRRDDEMFQQGPSSISEDERYRLQVGVGLTSGYISSM